MGKNQQHKAAQRSRHGDGEDGQPDLGTGEAPRFWLMHLEKLMISNYSVARQLLVACYAIQQGS